MGAGAIGAAAGGAIKGIAGGGKKGKKGGGGGNPMQVISQLVGMLENGGGRC